MSVVKQIHPAARINPECVAIDTVPITLSGGSGVDVDLTDPNGPTGGYCARGVVIGDTAGNVKFDTMTGETRTVAVIAGQFLRQYIAKIYSSADGTTAHSVNAVL